MVIILVIMKVVLVAHDELDPCGADFIVAVYWLSIIVRLCPFVPAYWVPCNSQLCSSADGAWPVANALGV